MKYDLSLRQGQVDLVAIDDSQNVSSFGSTEPVVKILSMHLVVSSTFLSAFLWKHVLRTSQSSLISLREAKQQPKRKLNRRFVESRNFRLRFQSSLYVPNKAGL